jgi:hypothetical protein
MRPAFALLILIPALTGCQHHDHEKKDISTFNKRMACAKLAQSGQWDDVLSPPFLDHTYYSPSIDTCVFVLKGNHRGEKDGGIHNEALIVDALTRKQLWRNDPEAGETEEQLAPKIDEQLKNLQITP